MSKKKSLYEILQVPNSATYEEIRTAYEGLLKALEDRQQVLGHEDFTMQMRLLKVAYSTLSSPQTRDAYDAHLTLNPTSPQPATGVRTALQTVPSPVVDPTAAAIHAEALMLRADAMALRADALGLKAQALGAAPLDGGATGGVRAGVIGGGRFKLYLRYGLLTLGTLAAISMVLKVVLMFSMGHNPDAVPALSPAAAEKVYLQDYYQTYGVRPASRAEADRLDAERAKAEEAQRAQRQYEEDQRKAASAESRFEEESRRRGEQVSMELQIADERARQAQLVEKREKEEAQERAAEAERQRIAQQQAKWQRALGTSGSN